MEFSISNLLHERGTIPWFSDHMRIGAGFDIHNFQTVRSPFKALQISIDPECVAASADRNIETQVIRD